MKTTRLYMFAIAVLPLSSAACGASTPSKELLTARDAQAKLQQSDAAQLNPAGTRDAQEALEAAEKAHKDDAGSEQERTASYIAARKSELAMAQADEARARQEREKSEQAYTAQVEKQLSATHQQLQEAQAASEKAKKDLVNWRKRGENLVVTLSGVVFESGTANLSADARQRLDAVANGLKEYPDRAVTIAGFTDNKGKQEVNRKLSQQRADSVRAYLITKGIPSARMMSEGKGDANPIASNETAAGRADNRRVEITLLPKGEASEKQLVKGTDEPASQTKSKK